MKIYSLLVEILIFLVVTLFFVCPPIFTTPGTAGEMAFVEWGFPFSRLLLAAFTLFLFLLYHNSEKSKENKFVHFPFRIIPTVCMLFTSAFFMNFLAQILPSIANHSNAIVQSRFKLPNNFLSWLFCILNFSLAAFYEEVLYRFYFTDKLISILKQINEKLDKKVVIIICEIIGCGVFALGHSYLGIFAVGNAAIAHFILRYTYKKSNSIIPGFIAHFIYNVTSLILL